jgi:hypothetical protein
MGGATFPSTVHSEGGAMSIIAIGLDLDKNVFAVSGSDDAGKALLIKSAIKRDALLQTMAKLPPCLIGREACSGGRAARLLESGGGHCGQECARGLGDGQQR